MIKTFLLPIMEIESHICLCGNGWGFVDVAEALADENGDLAAEYCSDGFAHQNPEASP